MLLHAAFAGDIARIDALLAAGVDPNAADSHGYTALIWAAQQPTAVPRLIGGMARTAPATSAAGSDQPRGIGRFTTLRTAPARRLL